MDDSRLNWEVGQPQMSFHAADAACASAHDDKHPLLKNVEICSTGSLMPRRRVAKTIVAQTTLSRVRLGKPFRLGRGIEASTTGKNTNGIMFRR